MPDPFFSVPKHKKRKRTDSNATTDPRKKFARKLNAPRDGKKPGTGKVNGSLKGKKGRADEELSDQTDEGEGGVDDMDLRAEEVDMGASGDEDENETPAEKRLRLAQLYLESVKVGLGMWLNSFFSCTKLTLYHSRWRI
jgi:ribosomal RNA-processing protein 9